jgi:hypothetical protein
MSDRIIARIIDRGWTFEHVLSLCAHCKRSRDLGAGAHHTGWWLGNQLNGYARGLHGLKYNRYDHVSSVSIPLDSIPLWSKAAKHTKNHKEVMIEHGTPKRQFVKMVYDVYVAGKLTNAKLDSMIENLWWVAVITKEEDARLSSNGWRSKAHDDGPKARWAAVGIQF